MDSTHTNKAIGNGWQPQAVITWICNVSRKEKHLSKFITVAMSFLLENVMLIARIFTLLKGVRSPLLTFCDVQLSDASFMLVLISHQTGPCPHALIGGAQPYMVGGPPSHSAIKERWRPGLAERGSPRRQSPHRHPNPRPDQK